MTTTPNAAIIIIGNEILSGRTQDTNVQYIANGLQKVGISLDEVRIIPDNEAKIIDNVNQLRSDYRYVFTTGGIGPTHDDITAASIAKAFQVELVRNEEATTVMQSYYTRLRKEMTEARLRMAYMPKGVTLIENPISGAPGFQIENVFVMAGIPSIMHEMFDAVLPRLTAGEVKYSCEVSFAVAEGKIADILRDIQSQYPNIEIGSYPFITDQFYGTSVVFKSSDQDQLEQAIAKTNQSIDQLVKQPI